MGLVYHGATASRYAQITVYVDSEFEGDLKLTKDPTWRPRYGFAIYVGNDLVSYAPRQPARSFSRLRMPRSSA